MILQAVPSSLCCAASKCVTPEACFQHDAWLRQPPACLNRAHQLLMYEEGQQTIRGLPDDWVPILSQLLKAELAEREVRSICCPAGFCETNAERGLPHESSALPCL